MSFGENSSDGIFAEEPDNNDFDSPLRKKYI